MQEEIKITGVTVFVNPYSEPDEEEEKEAAENEKKAEDEENVCFFDPLTSYYLCPLSFFLLRDQYYSPC